MINLCKEIRPNAYGLTLISPQSNYSFLALGNEDLDIYGRMLSAVKTTKGDSERAPWWKMLNQ